MERPLPLFCLARNMGHFASLSSVPSCLVSTATSSALQCGPSRHSPPGGRARAVRGQKTACGFAGTSPPGVCMPEDLGGEGGGGPQRGRVPKEPSAVTG